MPGTKVFAIDVAIGVGDKKEINFGLLKTRVEEGVFEWTIDFKFKEKQDNTMVTRVSVSVFLLDDKKKRRAEKLAEAQRLSQAKAKLLLGRVLDRARELPPGTTSDPELEALLQQVV